MGSQPSTPAHNLFSILDHMYVQGLPYLYLYIHVTVNNNLKSVLVTVSGDLAPVRRCVFRAHYYATARRRDVITTVEITT